LASTLLIIGRNGVLESSLRVILGATAPSSSFTNKKHNSYPSKKKLALNSHELVFIT